MMNIRKVGVSMAQRLMRMFMDVRLFAVPIRIVLVLMMGIVVV